MFLQIYFSNICISNMLFHFMLPAQFSNIYIYCKHTLQTNWITSVWHIYPANVCWNSQFVKLVRPWSPTDRQGNTNLLCLPNVCRTKHLYLFKVLPIQSQMIPKSQLKSFESCLLHCQIFYLFWVKIAGLPFNFESVVETIYWSHPRCTLPSIWYIFAAFLAVAFVHTCITQYPFVIEAYPHATYCIPLIPKSCMKWCCSVRTVAVGCLAKI